jgi:tetratricopeptide (TPR) repeat protein
MHYAEARAELKIAEPLLPNNAAAIFLDARLDRRENRWDDALIKARRAFELDPHHEFYIEWIAQSYGLLRRYDEGENFVREARARNPALADRLNGPLGNLALDRGDLAAAGALTSKEVTHDDFATHFCAAYFARDYARALKIVAAAKAEFVEKEMGLKSPQSLGEGLVFLHQGLSAKATAIFRVQRRLDDQGIGPESRNEWYYSSAALDDAHLGKKEQAIAEARKALDLHPLAVDPIDGAGLVKQLALVYAALGEIDPALEQLQILVKIPSNINYGELRSSPDWDALRGDPRFEKLIAESRQPVAGR